MEKENGNCPTRLNLGKRVTAGAHTGIERSGTTQRGLVEEEKSSAPLSTSELICHEKRNQEMKKARVISKTYFLATNRCGAGCTVTRRLLLSLLVFDRFLSLFLSQTEKGVCVATEQLSGCYLAC